MPDWRLIIRTVGIWIMCLAAVQFDHDGWTWKTGIAVFVGELLYIATHRKPVR